MSKIQLLLLSLLPAAAAAGLLVALVLKMGASTLMLWILWGASLVGCLGVLAVPVGILAFYRPAEMETVEQPAAAESEQPSESAEAELEETEDVADFDDDEDFQELADDEFGDEDLSDFDDDEDFV